MEEMGIRKADLQNMEPDGKGRIKLEFIAPSRGMIGFRSSFLTMTSDTRTPFCLLANSPSFAFP